MVAHLRALKHDVDDLGPQSVERIDYPDFAAPVGRAVRDTPSAVGVLVCGSGVGMCISANKVHGIRAVDAFSMESTRPKSPNPMKPMHHSINFTKITNPNQSAKSMTNKIPNLYLAGGARNHPNKRFNKNTYIPVSKTFNHPITNEPLRILKVPGGGSCQFHALTHNTNLLLNKNNQP